MDRFTTYLKNRPYKRWRIIAIIVLCGLLASRYFVWVHVTNNNTTASSKNFSNLIQADIGELKNRFEIYADTLYSGRALFIATTNVSRSQWSTFVNAQNITDRYPGINGLSYVTVIGPSQTADLTSQLNASRLPSETTPIHIYPAPNDSELAVLTYLAPTGSNQSAIGYDMYSSVPRRQVLEAARDTGTVQASAPLALVTDSKNAPPSILEVMPLYRTTSPATVAARQAALESYIVLSLHTKPLLDSIFGTAVNDDIAVTAITSNQVVYQRGKTASSHQEENVDLDVAGQEWTFAFTAPSNFQLTPAAERAPLIVMLSAIPFAILLSLMAYYAIRFKTLLRHHEEHHTSLEQNNQSHHH